MDHEIAVHVPVDKTRLPHDFEIVSVPLVVASDFGVLEVRLSMPVGAVHRVRLVAYLFHVNFGDGIGGVQKSCHDGARENVDHAGRKLKCPIAEALLGHHLRAAGRDSTAALGLSERQNQFGSN